MPFALPAMGSILTCISSTTGFATMRRIDRDRIEESYVVRTLVKCGEVRWHVLICERRWPRMRPIVMAGNDKSRTSPFSAPKQQYSFEKNRAARAGNRKACLLQLFAKRPSLPCAKIRLANIGCKVVRSVPRGRSCIRHRQVRDW